MYECILFSMMAFKLVFLAKDCYKVVVRSVKIWKSKFSLLIPTFKYYCT